MVSILATLPSIVSILAFVAESSSVTNLLILATSASNCSVETLSAMIISNSDILLPISVTSLSLADGFVRSPVTIAS